MSTTDKFKQTDEWTKDTIVPTIGLGQPIINKNINHLKLEVCNLQLMLYTGIPSSFSVFPPFDPPGF